MNKVLSWLKSWGVLILIIFLIAAFNQYAWFFAAFFVVFILYRLWIFRHNILGAMRMIETHIWGKPLDKELIRVFDFKMKEIYPALNLKITSE
jgi:hypothetical protein